MVKNTKKEGEVNESFFVQLGIKYGIKEIIKDHPQFKENEIIPHIDMAELQNKVYDMYLQMEKDRIPEQRRKDYIIAGVADYISKGEVLDDEGKEVILAQGLERKAQSGFFRGHGARKELKQKSELENKYGFSGAINKKEYTEMPEIAEGVYKLENMSKLSKMIDYMRHHGLVGERKYHSWQNKIYKRAEEAESKISSGIEKYVAASIIGILGIGLIAFSSKVTGAVVSSPERFEGGIVGFIFVIFSLVLFLFLSIKKFKKTKIKII